MVNTALPATWRKGLNGHSRRPGCAVRRPAWHKRPGGRRSTDPLRGTAGHTLTELLIVLGILAVALGLGSVWLASQLPYYRLNGAVRQIRTDLLAARAQAVRQGNEVRVFFTDSRHYEILDDDNNNGVSNPGEAVEFRSLLEDFPGVTIQSTGDRDSIFQHRNPIFYPRGTASNVTTVTVTNTAGAKEIAIGITGRVKIKPSS